MKVWIITTKKVKGYIAGDWIVMENYKKPTNAIIHFLGSYTWFKESDIVEVRKTKL